MLNIHNYLIPYLKYLAALTIFHYILVYTIMQSISVSLPFIMRHLVVKRKGKTGALGDKVKKGKRRVAHDNDTEGQADVAANGKGDKRRKPMGMG